MNDGNEYFYDKLEWVRVRVEEEHWNDLSPTAPSARGAESAAERKSPYSIVVGYPSSERSEILTFTGFHDAVRTGTCRMVVIKKASSHLFENYGAQFILGSYFTCQEYIGLEECSHGESRQFKL